MENISKLIIYTSLSFVMALTIKSSYQTIKKDGYNYISFLKEIYFKNFRSYIYAILILIPIIFISAFFIMYQKSLPNFLSWSWLSIFSEESTGSVVTKPLYATKDLENIYFKYTILFFIWMLFAFIIPLLAYNEEDSFRRGVHSFKGGIVSSIMFGLIHIIMGIPVFAVIILTILGFVLHIIYNKNMDIEIKNVNIDGKTQEEVEKYIDLTSIIHIGRIHALYNMIIITILLSVII